MNINSTYFSNILPSSADAFGIAPIRNEAKKRFLNATIPDRKQEAWRYTNVKPVFSTEYKYGNLTEPVSKEGFKNKLVFRNAVLDSPTSLPQGLNILPFAEALALGKVSGEDLLSKNTNVFTDLNLASLLQGYYIEVTQEVPEPISLEYHYTKDGNYNAGFLFVKVRAGAKATFVEDSSTETHFVNQQCRFYLEKKAHLDWIQIHETGAANKYQNVEAKLLEQSNLNYTQVNLGGGIVRQDLEVDILGAQANANLQGLYLLKDSQHVDNHTQVNHLVPNATCRQVYKGILDNKARAVFDGKIYVAPGADGTFATQLNKNILLSNAAEVDTKPQLEIYADDVKCNHGATLGKFSEEEIFYFLARGIHRSMAIRMLSMGFVRDILLQIENKEVQDALLPRINKTLKDYSF